MSAFMLSTASFQLIANALPWDFGRCQGYRLCNALRPDDKLAKVDEMALSDAIIRDWYKANRLAIAGRYGSKAADEIPAELPPRFGARCHSKPLTGPALFKLLQCLRYQCSETVAKDQAEWHEGIMNEIESAMEMIGHEIIRNLPEYEEAAWG